MFTKLRKPNKDGFTIIEVMIVLAIAALILLIVLLAVPALQRSSRNTQRKNDVASLAGAVANYISNNNGTIPNNIALAGNTATIRCATGGVATNCATANTNTETANIGVFTAITPRAGAAGLRAPDTNTVLYVPNFACDATNTGVGAAAPRSAIFLYLLEPNTAECTEQ